MNEQRLLQDSNGDLYLVALSQDEDGTYTVDEGTLEAGRLGGDEVSGYAGRPIPGVDIVVKKNPGGAMTTFTDFGLRPPSVAFPTAAP